MSASSIQARIKRGLSRAVDKTGSANRDLVYLVEETSAGSNDPNNPVEPSTKDTLLADAIFTSYDIKALGGNTEIKSGDRRLVSNSDVEIKRGATIKQGSALYYVVNTSPVAPTSNALVYTSQLRLKKWQN